MRELCEVLTKFLSQRGHAVQSAGNGKDALSVDWRHPNSSGNDSSGSSNAGTRWLGLPFRASPGPVADRCSGRGNVLSRRYAKPQGGQCGRRGTQARRTGDAASRYRTRRPRGHLVSSAGKTVSRRSSRNPGSVSFLFPDYCALGAGHASRPAVRSDLLLEGREFEPPVSSD